MRRAAKVTLAAVVIGIAIASATFVLSSGNDDVVRLGMEAKAGSLKQEIDRRFPAGTPRSEVIAFLKSQSGWSSEGRDDYWLSVGQAPSGVWYCGPVEVGVRVRFQQDQLVGVVVGSWGLDCL